MTYRAITLSMLIDAHMVACGVVQRLFHMSSSARAGSVSSGHAGAGCWLPVAGMDTKSAALPVFARWRCRLLCGLIGLANVVSLSVSELRTHQQLGLVHPKPAKALGQWWLGWSLKPSAPRCRFLLCLSFMAGNTKPLQVVHVIAPAAPVVDDVV